MLSGPDLGGGFLFQLSREPGPRGARFTFHAQDGGVDANGPPKGPLSPLEFTHPREACQFGGPRCWHRSFDQPETAALRVRVAYNRMRFVMEAMIAQLYADAPVPIVECLRELTEKAGPALEKAGIGWAVSGSVRDWLLARAVSPREVRILVTERGAAVLGELWSDLLIEPVGVTELDVPGSVVGGEAFLGTMKTGTRVRWVEASVSGSVPAVREGMTIPIVPAP